jgi:hypothetical protein
MNLSPRTTTIHLTFLTSTKRVEIHLTIALEFSPPPLQNYAEEGKKPKVDAKAQYGEDKTQQYGVRIEKSHFYLFSQYRQRFIRP